MRSPQLLSPEWLALVAKGVSAMVASRDHALRPSLMRAVGTYLDAGTGELTLYLRQSQSAALLTDLQASGRMAVVFSEPATHRTLQLKGRALHLRPATEADQPRLDSYRASMVREVGLVGYDGRFVAAMLAAPLRDVVAIAFQPEQAFDQTPGPLAGTPLHPAEEGRSA